MSLVKVAKIIINNPSKAVDKCFDYLFEQVQIGDHVIVPFGRGNTKTDGVVIDFGETEENEHLKKMCIFLSGCVTDAYAHIMIA